jgi:hypothetical protein
MVLKSTKLVYRELFLTDLFQYLFSLEMTEQEKLIADLGKPKLGEKNTIRIRIRESKEFKVNKKTNKFSEIDF